MKTQRTKTIQVGCITFRLGRAVISQFDPRLQDANTVNIEFIDQKNGHRYNKVTQHLIGPNNPPPLPRAPL